LYDGSVSFHYCNQIPKKINFKEKGFHFGSGIYLVSEVSVHGWPTPLLLAWVRQNIMAAGGNGKAKLLRSWWQEAETSPCGLMN
jgi:hypothetical protein